MRLELGRIGRAHGLRGDVHLVPVTNVADRFDVGNQVWVGDVSRLIVASRPHQDRWVVRFEGVEDRDAAERLRGLLVSAEPLDEPPAGELWVHELIGSEVRDTHGAVVGTVASVEANPAHDLLVLGDGKLVPIVFVVTHESGVVVIDPPAGLFDV